MFEGERPEFQGYLGCETVIRGLCPDRGGQRSVPAWVRRAPPSGSGAAVDLGRVRLPWGFDRRDLLAHAVSRRPAWGGGAAGYRQFVPASDAYRDADSCCGASWRGSGRSAGPSSG